MFSPAPASGAPEGYRFPFGQIAFKATGCDARGTLNVALALPSAPPAGTKLFKQIDGQWIPWRASFEGSQLQYTVTDNDGSLTAQATGDNNPALGLIDDPVLVAVPLPVVVPPTATPVPTLGQGALLMLGLLLAGVACVPRKRRASGAPHHAD
ncbi:hypothetical protein SDC9_106606 [bioreactor metagenome]|uniref:IPTL-CTERM protein sorting domain-containing protein n=1 Tax=bioreactor metagenome TaxID=1076179 RepID=A0A645B2S5_9ZZZZ